MKTLNTIKIIILALLIAVGVSYASAAWTEPTVKPTGGNTEVPINVSDTDQSKTGAFRSGDLIGSPQFCLIDPDTLDEKCISAWPSGGGSGGGAQISSTTIRSAGGDSPIASVSCNSNEIVTGGGCYGDGHAYMYRSYPDGNGWKCQSGSSATNATAYAVCAIGSEGASGVYSFREGGWVANGNSYAYCETDEIIISGGCKYSGDGQRYVKTPGALLFDEGAYACGTSGEGSSSAHALCLKK